MHGERVVNRRMVQKPGMYKARFCRVFDFFKQDFGCFAVRKIFFFRCESCRMQIVVSDKNAIKGIKSN